MDRLAEWHAVLANRGLTVTGFLWDEAFGMPLPGIVDPAALIDLIEGSRQQINSGRYARALLPGAGVDIETVAGL